MTATEADTIAVEHYRPLEADVSRSVDPDAAVDVACFMTTDGVDADDEVMLPSGMDLSRFEKNPVLLLCHGYGQPGSHYPLPIGRVPWTKKRPRGVLAGVKFATSTPMGREVKGLFEEGMLRSFSIGFRSLEASPMTRDEASSRPDWRAAFERTRGKITVHRRWQLLELSCVPLPANPDALVTDYRAKGLSPPSWLQLYPTPEAPAVSDHAADDATEAGGEHQTPEVIGAEDPETKAAETPEIKAAKPDGECSCGKPGCAECDRRVTTKAEDEEPEEPEDEDEDPEKVEVAGYKRGANVHVSERHYKGEGVIHGVYRKGHVPHIDDDVIGTKDEPIACIKCYKRYGDGYVPTKHHTHARLKRLKMMAEPMREPTRKKEAPAPWSKAAGAAAPPGEHRAAAAIDPLPPLVAKSDEELQREAFEALSRIPDLVDQAVAKYVGAV